MTPDFHINEHQAGCILRLRATDARAADAARDLLAYLEAELDAETEGAGWRQEPRSSEAQPVLIQLESLQVELSVDGHEVVLRRIAGSADEFDELCELVCERQNEE